MSQSIAVLFATQTGTAEDLAGQTAEALTAAGLPAAAVNLADATVDDVRTYDIALVVAATWGEGEPPDDCIDFYEAFSEAEGLDLSHQRYAVFALGDSNYEIFCGHGRDLDAAFARHGATALVPRVECDMDYDEKLPEWIDQLKEAIPAAQQTEAA